MSRSGFVPIFTMIVSMNLVDTYLVSKSNMTQKEQMKKKNDSDDHEPLSILDFVYEFAFDTLRKNRVQTIIIQDIVSKKRACNDDMVDDVVLQEDEVQGTQLEKDPKYVPPIRLQELLLYGVQESQIYTLNSFIRKVPETDLVEGMYIKHLCFVRSLAYNSTYIVQIFI